MALVDADAIDGDWDFFEGVVKVSYVPYVNDDDGEEEANKVNNVDALQQQEDRFEEELASSDIAAGAAVFRVLRTWNLRAYHMPGVQVTKRGVIREADGTEWVVIRCLLKSFKTRWLCECYRREGA